MTYLQQLHQWSSKNQRLVRSTSCCSGYKPSNKKGIQFVQDGAHLEQNICSKSGFPLIFNG